MSILAFIPAIIIAAVFCSVCAVCIAISLDDRARARRNAARLARRKVFRPVIIQGGKPAPDKISADIAPEQPGRAATLKTPKAAR
jgi:hypothetical protein